MGGAIKSSTSSFRSALVAAHAKLSEPADRAHIERWLGSANDPVWKKIVTEILSDLKYEPSQELIAANYGWIITTGLRARWAAEHAAKTGEDREYENIRAYKAHLLKLAESAEYLATYYAERTRSQLAGPLENDAVVFRDLAAKVRPKSRVRVSRQTGGKKRAHFRVYGAFLSYVISIFRENLGKPHYQAVVTMTNIAFPKADVTEEDAKSVWRAMAGKRRRTARQVHSAAD